MSTSGVAIDLADPRRNGAFLVGEDDLDALARGAEQAQLRVCRVSLRDCHDKAGLFDRLVAGLHLPVWFGHNWDALSDCLRDMDWLPASGYVVLVDHAIDLRDAAEPDFDQALDIFDEAATSWIDDNVPFFVFLALPEHAFEESAD